MLGATSSAKGLRSRVVPNRRASNALVAIPRPKLVATLVKSKTSQSSISAPKPALTPTEEIVDRLETMTAKFSPYSKQFEVLQEVVDPAEFLDIGEHNMTFENVFFVSNVLYHAIEDVQFVDRGNRQIDIRMVPKRTIGLGLPVIGRSRGATVALTLDPDVSEDTARRHFVTNITFGRLGPNHPVISSRWIPAGFAEEWPFIRDFANGRFIPGVTLGNILTPDGNEHYYRTVADMMYGQLALRRLDFPDQPPLSLRAGILCVITMARMYAAAQNSDNHEDYARLARTVETIRVGIGAATCESCLMMQCRGFLSSIGLTPEYLAMGFVTRNTTLHIHPDKMQNLWLDHAAALPPTVVSVACVSAHIHVILEINQSVHFSLPVVAPSDAQIARIELELPTNRVLAVSLCVDCLASFLRGRSLRSSVAACVTWLDRSVEVLHADRNHALLPKLTLELPGVVNREVQRG